MPTRVHTVPDVVSANLATSGVGLALYLLASWGAASLVISLAHPFVRRCRFWIVCKLLSCEMCLGAWLGFALSLAGYGFGEPLRDACAAAGFSWLMRVVTAKLGADDL